MTAMYPRIFAGLGAPQTLHLGGNQLTARDPSMFAGLGVLQTLNLAHCYQLQVTTLTNVCRQLAAGKAFLYNAIDVLSGIYSFFYMSVQVTC